MHACPNTAPDPCHLKVHSTPVQPQAVLASTPPHGLVRAVHASRARHRSKGRALHMKMTSSCVRVRRYAVICSHRRGTPTGNFTSALSSSRTCDHTLISCVTLGRANGQYMLSLLVIYNRVGGTSSSSHSRAAATFSFSAALRFSRPSAAAAARACCFRRASCTRVRCIRNSITLLGSRPGPLPGLTGVADAE